MLAFIVNNIFGWQFWLGVLLTILIFLWLFFGGKNHEYIGLAPLKIGVDASKYVDDSTYHKSARSNRNAKQQYSAAPVDNTPQIPDLKKKHKKIRFVNDTKHKRAPTFSISSEQFDLDEPSIGDYVCSESYEIKSPRSLALGEHKIWNNKRRSKGEELCKRAIEEIYGKPFYTIRPEFLKNPETNRRCEIDLYNDSEKLGVEYSGVQHYVFPNTYHKTYDEFINQVRRDNWKVNKCDQEGVYLITVPYNVSLDYGKIKEYIEYYLPENVAKRQEE